MHFDEWHSRLHRTCGHYYGVPGRGRHDIDGHFKAVRFHGLDMANVACDLDLIERSPDGIRRDENEHIFLFAQLSGRSLVEQQGQQDIVEAGEFYLLDSTKVAQIRYQRRTSHFLSVHLPRGTFLLEADNKLAIGRTLKSGHPMNAAMRALFTKGAGKWRNAWHRERDPSYLFDLVRIAFTPEQDAMDATRMSSRENRFALAVSVMERNLTNPQLSLNWLARKIGISERQLQRDFLDNGTSFIQLLRKKRLVLATELLSLHRPAESTVNITDVAMRSGFNDISNFNRSFKGRYGCSPSQYAREHA